MKVLFIEKDGTETTRDLTRGQTHCARFCVPVAPQQIATVDDFRLIDLDAVWNPRPVRYGTRVYRRVVTKDGFGNFVYFKFESETQP